MRLTDKSATVGRPACINTGGGGGGGGSMYCRLAEPLNYLSLPNFCVLLEVTITNTNTTTTNTIEQ